MKRAKEFSRPIELDRIPRTGSHEHFAADEQECKWIAEILKVPAVHSVKVKFHATPWRGGGLKVKGNVTTELTQTSVISLEDFRSTESYDTERYFAKNLPEDNPEADIDILSGRAIDLAAIAVETIGLELDPYPRKPGEVFAASGGDLPEESVVVKIIPVAKLSNLKNDKTSG
jgi:uncharacterized metal-binding protein YceD (DUF177 family)